MPSIVTTRPEASPSDPPVQTGQAGPYPTCELGEKSRSDPRDFSQLPSLDFSELNGAPNNDRPVQRSSSSDASSARSASGSESASNSPERDPESRFDRFLPPLIDTESSSFSPDIDGEPNEIRGDFNRNPYLVNSQIKPDTPMKHEVDLPRLPLLPIKASGLSMNQPEFIERPASSMPHPLDPEDPVLRKLMESKEWTHMFPDVMTCYTCRKCGVQFHSLGEVSMHVRYTHWHARCEFCYTPFKDEQMLKKHIQFVHADNQCEKCGKICASQKRLWQHRHQAHSGKEHRCKCGKVFARKRQLQAHMTTHSKTKPYGCDICQRRFADRSNLRRHRRTHSNVKKFGCKVCGKLFARNEGLKLHTFTHTGEKPFKCSVCGKGFRHRSHVVRHARKTHS